jgi:hypothetical protein
LRISPFKPLPQTLLVEGTSVVAERTGPIGLVQVVRSELIPFRIAPGLSLMNRQEPAPQLGLFVDGEGPTPVTRFDGDFGPLAYLDATLAALPHRLLDRPGRVLLLGLGGGADLLLALRHGRARWTWSSRTATWPTCCAASSPASRGGSSTGRRCGCTWTRPAASPRPARRPSTT